MKRLILLLPLLLVAGLYLNWQLSTPSHDRDWKPDHSRLPMIAPDGDAYRVQNIRNWNYAPDGSTSQHWIERRIDPATLKQGYFLMEPFGSVAAIAHTMVAFEFDNGEVYVVSVEARREVGEKYSAPKAAVLPIFEYMFVWSTERDMYGNSEFAAGDQLYLYALDIPLDHQRAVLKAMLRETEKLQDSPRWYNTLFSNCTNVLARSINKVAPGAVPFDKSWVLPGYADEFLFEQGMLKAEGDFAQTNAAAHISPLIRQLYDITDPVAFSAAVRQAKSGG